MQNKKLAILHYLKERNEAVTAKEIVNALYPGKMQVHVNPAINELVKEGKLVRTNTRPYRVWLVRPGEKLPDLPVVMPASTSLLVPKIKVARPCEEEAEKYFEAWDKQESYRLQEAALNQLFFKMCPENKKIEDILVKTATLNDFYSTNIFSVYPVAKKILALNIDERLVAGDLTLVNDIAKVKINGKEKTFYSFATKYCSHHQPKKFAIYDSYVDKILKYFRDKDGFSEFYNTDLKDYAKFNKVLGDFQKFYGLEKYDLKNLDRYLWQLGKAAFPRYKK